MLSRGWPRALRIAGTFLLTGTLFAPAAGAQEDSLQTQLVFPAPGASDVVLNPGLLLRIAGAGLDRSAAPEGASLAGGLVVRDATGNLLGVGELALREVDAYCGGNCDPRDDAVEIATAPLALAAASSYEVLSQIGVCPLREGTSVTCLQGTFRSLGRFQTGTRADVQAPSIQSAGVEASTEICARDVSVQASDDSAAGDSIRFFVVAGQPALFGPRFTVHGVYSRSGQAQLSLIPVDPSGNQGQPFALSLSACADPNEQESDILPLAAPHEEPDFSSGGTRWSGCALHAPGSRSAGSSVAAVAGALLFSGVYRRQRRASQRHVRSSNIVPTSLWRGERL